MKVSVLMALAVLALFSPAATLGVAVTKTTWSDAPTREFVFVKNDSSDNFFVTPGGALNPRIAGASRWAGLKCTDPSTIYRQGPGYVNGGYNTGLNASWEFDTWLENLPVSHPLIGLRCINRYAGCDMATGLILPQTTDASGPYGTTVISGGARQAHGMMSDASYQYLQQMPVGGSFTMTIDACQTLVNYDTNSGACYKDQASGNQYARNVTHTKTVDLRLINTCSLAEVSINSDGVLTLGEGNADCQTQAVGSRAGLNCRMVNYILQANGLSNISIRIFPTIANSLLVSTAGTYDMQFSLNGSSWKLVSNITYYYTFNEVKSSDSIYVFFPSNFFKQMMSLGTSSINTKGLFNFRFQNTTSLESGWHEFFTSDTLITKLRDFSTSIIPDKYTSAPSHEGYAGNGKSTLDFGYIVTTSGKITADEVPIKTAGSAQAIGRRSYCLFSSDGGTAKMPFPATLSFITHSGMTQTYDAGCDDSWQDITDALWLTTPWTDISGEMGQMDKTMVKFSIPMDNAISLWTVGNNGWLDEVGTLGEIHAQMAWRSTN